MRKCSKSLAYFYTRAIGQIEKIVDEESGDTHKQISEEIENYLEDKETGKHCEKNGVFHLFLQSEFVDR
jgi:hypothetical protein